MVLSEKRSFRNFKKKEQSLTTEQKIEHFILRNSDNGYFTKVSTIPYKFEISQNKVWGIIGELLENGNIESIHDEMTGEMKLCKIGKTYSIMGLEKNRKAEKYRTNKKSSKSKTHNTTKQNS